MRYFVTGATGFVGGRVVQLLRQEGHEVNALVRSPQNAGALVALGARLFAGDVTQRESLRAPMAGVDGVFHIAGWYKLGARDKSQGARVNIDGTRNVLELMRELGIHKGVYTSTLAVNSSTHGVEVDESYHFSGKHLSEYDRTKAAAHDIAETMIRQGLPLVIVQPGLIYGPGDTSSMRGTLIQYLKRRLPLIPLESAYCWGHIDDIAHAHIAAMTRGSSGESYFICGPTHTFQEAIQMAEAITGITGPRLSGSPALLRAMSGFMGVIERVIPLPVSFTSEFLRVSAGSTYIGRNDKARRELGFLPRPLETGLRETLAHELRLLGMA